VENLSDYERGYNEGLKAECLAWEIAIFRLTERCWLSPNTLDVLILELKQMKSSDIEKGKVDLAKYWERKLQPPDVLKHNAQLRRYTRDTLKRAMIKK